MYQHGLSATFDAERAEDLPTGFDDSGKDGTVC